MCDDYSNCVERPDDYFRRRNDLTNIIDSLRIQQGLQVDKSPEAFDKYGDAPSSAEALESGTPMQTTKLSRKRRMERSVTNNNGVNAAADYAIHNNNNHVKNERLSPGGTTDVSSRSRSVTPSPASHPSTPPASDNHLLPRNYSDIMRSLAAKYNHVNPNDYFTAARNGFAPPIDSRFKPSNFPGLLPVLPPSKDGESSSSKKNDFTSMINPFANGPVFAPMIDMTSTQALVAMMRTAKEVEIQGLLKNVKRPDPTTPLDLSAAAPPPKRARTKTSASNSPVNVIPSKRAQSESPRLHEDVSNWTVDDVCNFVASIDICAEYAQNFRDQRIDGSGLPLLTEDHLTSTMHMKLGPALKLRSILARKLGSCSVCLHCSHCHNSGGSPEPPNTAGNTSDSGGTS